MKSPDLGRAENCLQLFVEIRGYEIGERIEKDLGDGKKISVAQPVAACCTTVVQYKWAVVDAMVALFVRTRVSSMELGERCRRPSIALPSVLKMMNQKKRSRSYCLSAAGKTTHH